MKTFFLSIAIFLMGISSMVAQEKDTTELSLKECVQTAVEKNINTRIARINYEKSEYAVSESFAALLPNIGISGSFRDNVKLPTTLLPGEIFGSPGTSIAVQMGRQFNTNAAININQILYNKTALTALKISKEMVGLNALSIEKASEQLASEVSKLYFLSLVTEKQKTLVGENIERTERQRDIVKLLVDNGISMNVDYQRISVNLENLYTQLSNTEATLEQQFNMIKYILDIPIDEMIVLSDTAEIPLLGQTLALESDFSDHVDMKILESQKEINLLNKKLVNDSYLPTLSFTGSYSYQGMRQDFKNYFKSSPENNWYASAYVGLNLSIPIFNGFEKKSKSRQATLEYQKSEMTMVDTQKQFTISYQDAINNYQNHKTNVERQKMNIELAEKVYNETALKYREGLSTMSDLLQDEQGLSNSQSSYLSALYNLKDAELKVISLNGEIRNLINE